LNGSDARLRDLLIALSLANFSLIEVWDALLNYTPVESFYLAQAPSHAQYMAAFANIFLIGLAFFLLIRLARWIAARYGSTGFLFGSVPIFVLIALPTFKAIVRLLSLRFFESAPRTIAGVVILLLAVTAVLARRRIVAMAPALLIMFSPLIPIEAAVALSRLARDNTAEFLSGPLAPRVDNSLPRVVWIVFDELDYRLSFPERPPGLAMPEFDRLRAESVFAENAVPPGRDTAHSVPSLLTGKSLAAVHALGPGDVLFDGILASKQPSIFSSVHGMGGNAAVVGWYLPYGRVFSRDLAACSWHAIESILAGTRGTFWESVVYQEQSLLEYGHYSLVHESLAAKYRIAMLGAMHRDALRDSADPSLNFLFLHLPVPHAPHFYDRLSRTFTKRNPRADGYPDSLALADIFLGDIRASMIHAGLWDKTTVLISSDHPDRSSRAFDGKADSRVPFLLKLAGQTSGITYAESLRTVVTKALLEAILKRQITTSEDAVRWLRTHRF
jgi:hypothetical protein